jgi:hypothetical protein
MGPVNRWKTALLKSVPPLLNNKSVDFRTVLINDHNHLTSSCRNGCIVTVTSDSLPMTRMLSQGLRSRFLRNRFDGPRLLYFNGRKSKVGSQSSLAADGNAQSERAIRQADPGVGLKASPNSNCAASSNSYVASKESLWRAFN